MRKSPLLIRRKNRLDASRVEVVTDEIVGGVCMYSTIFLHKRPRNKRTNPNNGGWPTHSFSPAHPTTTVGAPCMRRTLPHAWVDQHPACPPVFFSLGSTTIVMEAGGPANNCKGEAGGPVNNREELFMSLEIL